jgi:hypothetical protein
LQYQAHRLVRRMSVEEHRAGVQQRVKQAPVADGDINL